MNAKEERIQRYTGLKGNFMELLFLARLDVRDVGSFRSIFIFGTLISISTFLFALTQKQI